MYLVINKCVTAVKVSNFSGHYLRNRSTLDIGVLGYIGIVQHKEHPPEVFHIPPGTPCIWGVIDCNEWKTEKRNECANTGKVKRLELWWQLYHTSHPVRDLENFRPMDFCSTECTFSECLHCGIPYCLQIILTLKVMLKTRSLMSIQFCKQYGIPQCTHSLNVPVLCFVILAWWWLKETETCRQIF